MKHNVEDLIKRYSLIPEEIKLTKRWICYNIETDPITGEQKKVPTNAITGGYARSNDSLTWTTFNVAINGCVKYGFVGLGFMLGEDTKNNITYFGIDLDNHEDKTTGEKPMNDEQFKIFCDEFINGLNSYTEYSHSGEGIHIICKGKLPDGARRRNGVAVEMYDKGRFFTMTGKVIKNLPISDRTEQVKPLWEKYLNVEKEYFQEKGIIVNDDGSVKFGGADRLEQTVIERTQYNLDDEELIQKIKASKNSNDFIELYYNGNLSLYSGDHSSADMGLCKILAFWTGCNQIQMDRIFRQSALMRPKWDEKRGKDVTYGSITLMNAINSQRDVYTPPKEKVVINYKQEDVNKDEIANSDIVRFDEKGDPIIVVKQIFKSYPLTDTGNAERFYDYFGDRFKFNKDNNYFMFWTGKTWIKDDRGYVRKYANKMIDILKDEVAQTEKRIDENLKKGDDGVNEASALEKIRDAQVKNITRISNKAGKDAMISELHDLHDLPVGNNEFDTQDNYLNTDSGVVDLNTGEILPFNKKYMLSKNTNCKVDFGEPVTFLKFLHDIFERSNPQETEEIINTMQLMLAYSASGRTNKEYLSILYGNGSNGKSTFIKTIDTVFGDYAKTMSSALLIQNPNASNQSNEFALSSLLGARFISTSETAEGKKLDEVAIKQMLSGEKIAAQFKYGQPFSFTPTFSPWMSTNNKPIIRATDFGTWRRLFFFPFLNTFTDDKKDVNMPRKLQQELPKILGWIIKGSVRLVNEYKGIVPKPKCLEEALADYKNEMDVIVSFIKARCVDFPQYKTSAVQLYNEYKDWAKSNNEYLMSETKFKAELTKRGYVQKRDANLGRVYIGLKLSTDRRGMSFEDME